MAAKYPDKLQEMKELFLERGRRSTRCCRWTPRWRRAWSRRGRTSPPAAASSSTPADDRHRRKGDSPLLLNSSYTVTADIEVPEGGAEGMILTSGGRFGGYGFYLLKGKPVFLWNLVDLKRVRWEGPDALPPGKHTLEFDFKYDGLGSGTLAFNNMSGIGRGGTGVLKVDGKEVATQKMERTLPLILQWDETFDIGSDTGTPV